MNALEVTSIPYKMSGAHQKGPKTVNAPAEKPGVLKHLANHKKARIPTKEFRGIYLATINATLLRKKGTPNRAFLNY